MLLLIRNKQGELIALRRNLQGRLQQTKKPNKQKIRASQLEIQNKELEQFAYAASHDLQEPLRTILSFVQLLKKRYSDELDKQADTYLDLTFQAASRMNEPLDQIFIGVLPPGQPTEN